VKGVTLFHKAKTLIGLVLATSLLLLGTGCANTGPANSSMATRENPLVISLPHNMSETHTVHIALQGFADEVYERTDGRIKINIYPNAQLGSENEVAEQLMAGVVQMTKVSAPVLATYDPGYNTFGLPFLFDNEESYYKVMDSPQMQDFFLSSEPNKFVGITYFTSGQRSFYTKNTPIRTPEDLKGMKIRVQDMRSQTEMVKDLGGTPVAMAYGDVYTALQTGIIDGTENNETALTTGKHGEVCKYYSYTEHTMIPDMLVMSAKTWGQLSDPDRQIVLEAARNATQAHKAAWAEAVEQAKQEAEDDMGVQFIYDVDKQAFRDDTASMVQDYAKEYPRVQEVLDIIDQVQG
jgi:tripartite ATP-independent transporter DctP family solute receptor